MEYDVLHQHLLLYILVLYISFYFAMVHYVSSILSILTAFKPFILQPDQLNVLKRMIISTQKRQNLKNNTYDRCF